ncbi:hypothetical protein [Lentzea albida]|uniref:ATP-binding protein n=1 Tax=Lentzea albida TaxID=65499 RepID=A0A1H9GIV3_9PSEU|nr:hypothetical protein [Lentzea albida]SEQ50004.1 hypothetical protein SAMN04488000_103144 [Lentzea albida]
MSRSGLFRAAALLAASAAPLLAAGSANAAELPQLGSTLPEVGADQLASGATQLTNPLEAASALQLPHVGTPVASDLPVAGALPVPALPGAAQERSLPATPDLAGLPQVATPEAHGGNTHLGSVRAPMPSGLPTEGAVPNPTVLSGVLPTING